MQKYGFLPKFQNGFFAYGDLKGLFFKRAGIEQSAMRNSVRFVAITFDHPVVRIDFHNS